MLLGNTNTSGSLWLARYMLQQPEDVFGNRPAVPNVAVLITDGIDNMAVTQLDDEVYFERIVLRYLNHKNAWIKKTILKICNMYLFTHSLIFYICSSLNVLNV